MIAKCYVARWVRVASGGAIFAIISATAGSADSAGAETVLHEYVPPDPIEDLRLGATTGDGVMAAAIRTQAGPVSAPEPNEKQRSKGAVYASSRSPAGAEDAFRIDRETKRPEVAHYDEPFTPAVAPYKREFAYDTVDGHFDLVVRDARLEPIKVGGVAADEDDQFYGDLWVELTGRGPVRIPTVGPGTRALSTRVEPPLGIQLFRDSADNWFVKGEREGRVRLVLHLAADRAAFGSNFADVDWPRLWRFLPDIPQTVKAEGTNVARQIGVVDGTGPGEALRLLVRYFREFSPSEEAVRAASGRELYRELSVSKKGVCRHRAYAFVVTALAIGIPSRFVRNEAHAWVEVFDSQRWHRIDLGGAADRLDFAEASRIAHVPPRDPFEWPASSDSGQAAVNRTRETQNQANGDVKAARTPNDAVSPALPADDAPAEAAGEKDAADTRPPSTVLVKVERGDTRRGTRVRVSGRVEAGAAPCADVRVDLFLEAQGSGKSRIMLGTLVTSREGRYDGRVVVPFGVPPGDYDVRATTPGNSACGEGTSP